MNNLYRLLLCCLMLVISLTNIYSKDKIVIALGEWDPYVSEQLLHFGVLPRIVKEAFELEGIEVEYKFYPWKRAFEYTKTGEVDGTFPWQIKDDYINDFYFSEKPLYLSTFVFFHLKDNPFDWAEIKDLEGKKIGATIGYQYTKEFLEASDSGSLKILWGRSDSINLNMILKKRIDVFPLNIDVGSALLSKEFTLQERSQFTYHPKPFKTHNSYLLLSKVDTVNEGIMEKFNRGFERLKESGKYNLYFEESRSGLYIKN